MKRWSFDSRKTPENKQKCARKMRVTKVGTSFYKPRDTKDNDKKNIVEEFILQPNKFCSFIFYSSKENSVLFNTRKPNK